MSSTSSGYSIGQHTDTNITSPSNGQLLQCNGTSWVNASNCTLTQLNISNSGNTISVVSPTLSSSSNYFLPTTASPSAGLVLTCNAVLGTSNTLSWMPANTLQFNYIKFLNLNDFIGNNINIDVYSNAYIFDITGCPNNSVINLPSFGMQNNVQFYLQIVGNQVNNTIVKKFSNWIYTSNQTGSIIGTALNVNTTYCLTYYATAGNPFGTNYPSYTMTPYSVNTVPLNNFIDCYILLPNMTYSCVGVCEMAHGM